VRSEVNIPRFAFNSVGRIVLSLLVISTIADLVITVFYLSQGTSIVFPNIYYFTIVLASYWFRWKGALFSCVLSGTYLALSAYYDAQFVTMLQAFIRAVIFILIALVVAYLSTRLDDEKRRYQTIFSTSGSGMVVVMRQDHTIKEANERFLGIVNLGSVEGMNLEAFLTKKDLVRLEGFLQEDHIVNDLEMELTTPSGEIRNCLISGSDLGPDELVISIMDITERKKAHITIEEANRKLNILSSITRHDSCNKLFTLSGHLGLHQRTVTDGPEKKRMEMMHEIVYSLSEQLDFAENYRRIGIKSPEWQSIQKAIHGAASHFDHPEVAITVDPGDLEVLADPMLKKVFYNLIDNSIKHGVKTTNIRISSVINEEFARIVYEDNGVGIPIGNKERIFEDGHGNYHGMGLYLIREILKITCIEIRETGTPGIGARFEISIPSNAYRMQSKSERTAE
jgi:signal transduction histidine kinase